VTSRIVLSCVFCVAFVGSAETLNAAPPDSPGTIYIDGVPCNTLCQSYMAWSRAARAAALAQNSPNAVTRHATEAGTAHSETARSKPAVRERVARRTSSSANDAHREKITEAADARKKPAAKQAEPPVQTEATGAKQAAAPPTDQAEARSARQTEDSSTKLAAAPNAEQVEAPDARRADAPASLAKVDPAASSQTNTIREQVMAAATMAEQLTIVANATPEPKAMDSEQSSGSGRPDDDKAASASSNADGLVALLISRPEIMSMSDLTAKTVAIDNSRSESQNNVRTALVAAGAPEVELSSSETKAIDRLVGGDVPAAIVALVSPDAAEAFPEIAGFRVFRIPLSPRSVKTGADTP
jgi:hypothetical protein